MIELNLLPEIKLEYIKAKRARRIVLLASTFVAIGSLALVVITASVYFFQAQHLKGLNADIASTSKELQDIDQLDKILTVQNQLSRLTTLHDQKPEAARVFTYLNQTTPTEAKISTFTLDFTLKTVSITGTADALSSVNKYVDTLKFTTYKNADTNEQTRAFGNLVLSSFSVSGNEKDPNQKASYTITASYDPLIFDTTKAVALTVPSITTSRSEVEKPDDLFTQPITDLEAGAQ